jgi:uncharacterized membrane protein YhaH (DUF805 family)
MDSCKEGAEPVTAKSKYATYYSRGDFFWSMISIWIILPVAATLILNYFGIDIGGIEKRLKVSDGQLVGKGFSLDLFSVWFIQFPLHIHRCYKRVIDMGINKWFTALLCIPPIHLLLLFWPSKKI